jgi:hypothetical protein
MVIRTQAQFTAESDVWQRALIRATARPYLWMIVDESEHNDLPTTTFRVSSASEAGRWHWVVVATDGAGASLFYDCPAGQHNKPCAHMAIALREVGLLTAPAPVTFSAPDEAA